MSGHTVWRCAECSYKGIDLGTGRVRGGEGYAGLCIPCSIKRADEALAYCPALVDWLVVYLRAELATERADHNADLADAQRAMPGPAARP